MMKRAAGAVLIAAALGATAGPVHGADWPKLDGETRFECLEALQLGKAAFQSNREYLFEPAKPPRGFLSALVLGGIGLDLSGGDAIEADPAAFIKLGGGDHASSPRNIYWQIKGLPRYRLALVESPGGWRGDSYELYRIDSAVSQKDLIDSLSAGTKSLLVQSTTSTGLRPPQVFRRPDDGALWAITVGAPWEALAGWTVYVPEVDSLRPACTIRFRPAIEHGVDLLPPAVRTLERLLDRTMGSGIGEGTMAPTAALRTDVEIVWANAALRPWVSHTPYNRRVVVDAALQRWARASTGNRRLLRAIGRQYGVAQGAMATYYRGQFGLEGRAAARLAGYHLDIALRSHYVFSADDTGEAPADGTVASTNPWKR